jgi:16S rRNA G1207 methylase RsmC
VTKVTTKTEFRFRGMTMLTASHPAIRRVKRQDAHPSMHGDKLWKSSLLLIDYLNKHRPEYTNNVLDVGCGWGPSGIWCARKLGSDVTSVDADENVFPYLDAIAQVNKVTTRPLVSRFEKLSKRQLAEFEMQV